MASFNKFNCFVEDVAEKQHNLGSDTLKIQLTNTAPAATDTAFNTTAYPNPAAANGYTSGGATVTVTASSQTSGTYSLVGNDVVFTASGGQIGPFRSEVLTLGFADANGDIVLAAVERPVPNGVKMC